MADFNKPNASSDIVTVMSEIRDNESANARQFKGAVVDNIPLNAVKFDEGVHYRWDSLIWNTENIAIAGGGTGSSTASGARANLDVYSTSDTDGLISNVNTVISDHSGRTDNPHSVTKSQVGLGNVQDYGISDVISNSSITYASLAAVYSHSSRTDNPHSVTKAQVGLGSVNNWAASDIISNTSSQYATSAAVYSHSSRTDNPHSVTKSQIGLSNVQNYSISDAIDENNSSQYASSAAVFAVATASQPTGSVITFAGNTPPSGFLECDGGEYSRSTYSDLFSVIGEVYGSGNGTTTFNVPDLRAEFIRGWDNGRGIDTGRSFGSSQTDAFKSHSHSMTVRRTGEGGATSSQSAANGSDFEGNMIWNTDESGGTETRPRNVAMMYCIKY